MGSPRFARRVRRIRHAIQQNLLSALIFGFLSSSSSFFSIPSTFLRLQLFPFSAPFPHPILLLPAFLPPKVLSPHPFLSCTLFVCASIILHSYFLPCFPILSVTPAFPYYSSSSFSLISGSVREGKAALCSFAERSMRLFQVHLSLSLSLFPSSPISTKVLPFLHAMQKGKTSGERSYKYSRALCRLSHSPVPFWMLEVYI